MTWSSIVWRNIWLCCRLVLSLTVSEWNQTMILGSWYTATYCMYYYYIIPKYLLSCLQICQHFSYKSYIYLYNIIYMHVTFALIVQHKPLWHSDLKSANSQCMCVYATRLFVCSSTWNTHLIPKRKNQVNQTCCSKLVFLHLSAASATLTSCVCLHPFRASPGPGVSAVVKITTV